MKTKFTETLEAELILKANSYTSLIERLIQDQRKEHAVFEARISELRDARSVILDILNIVKKENSNDPQTNAAPAATTPH